MLIKCAHCGKKFEPNRATQIYCGTNCRANAYRKWKPRKKPSRPLRQWLEEAAACGMSYGKYRCAIEQLGKTFEELKTDYENNRI